MVREIAFSLRWVPLEFERHQRTLQYGTMLVQRHNVRVKLRPSQTKSAREASAFRRSAVGFKL